MLLAILDLTPDFARILLEWVAFVDRGVYPARHG